MLLLPVIVLLPFVSIVPMLLVDRRHSYKISLIASSINLLLIAVAAFFAYTQGTAGASFSIPYITSLGISFTLQITGLSLLLVIMTGIVFFACSVVAEYFIGKGERLYNIIFMAAEGASLGVFLSGNLFLFYVFWEIAEFMMFFIIFLYGGYARRYAAVKFIIYSLVSSLLLLIGIILLYSNTHTFDIASLSLSTSSIPINVQFAITILLVLAFMIKMPIFPLHTWLPDAHTEAPTTGSMILAGVLLKFGGYGFLLLFYLIRPATHVAYYLAILFGFSAIYAALSAFRQTNIKRMIAYTSITDMSIIAIGVASINLLGSSGAVYAMLNHGLAISLLFLIAGTLDELYGTLEISKIKGIIRSFPGLAYLFIAGVVAAIGIPMTAGFIGDLLIFIGAMEAFGLAGIFALAAIFIMGVFLFWTIDRMFLSQKVTAPYNTLSANIIRAGVFLMVMTVLFGLFPFVFIIAPSL